MRFENAGVLRAEALADFSLDVEDFMAGSDNGLLQALNFAGDVGRLDLISRNNVVLRSVKDEKLAAGDPGRHRSAAEDSLPGLRKLQHGPLLLPVDGFGKRFLENALTVWRLRAKGIDRRAPVGTLRTARPTCMSRRASVLRLFSACHRYSNWNSLGRIPDGNPMTPPETGLCRNAFLL